MARFFTADLHLGHRNIIEYAERPFRGVDEMNEALVRKAWTVVGQDDELWVLGDLALGSLDESLAVASRLPGKKTLIVGNHDRPFRFEPGPKRDAQIARYEEVGFTVITDSWIEDEIAGHPVLLSHFPYIGDSHDGDRYTAQRPVDAGLPLIHGHVHTAWGHRGREFNVGVDTNFFAPVSEKVLAHWLKTRK